MKLKKLTLIFNKQEMKINSDYEKSGTQPEEHEKTGL